MVSCDSFEIKHFFQDKNWWVYIKIQSFFGIKLLGYPSILPFGFGMYAKG